MTQPDGLLPQHNLLGAVIDTDWATRLDMKIARHIISRYYSRFGNARASLRFLEQATGSQRPNVIASIRRLVDRQVFSVIRPGEGTRPTEYGLNFAFPASGTADNTAQMSLAVLRTIPHAVLRAIPLGPLAVSLTIPIPIY